MDAHATATRTATSTATTRPAVARSHAVGRPVVPDAVRRAAALVGALVLLAGCGGAAPSEQASTPAAPATTPATATTTPATATTPASSAEPTGPGTVTVAVFQFTPVPLTVAAGTTVTFANRDDTTHEPMSGRPGAVTTDFDLPLEGRGATASVRLDRPGTYPYFCAIHDAMTGEIVVTA